MNVAPKLVSGLEVQTVIYPLSVLSGPLSVSDLPIFCFSVSETDLLTTERPISDN